MIKNIKMKRYTKDIIAEKNGKKITIYSKKVINDVYGSLCGLVYEWNRTTASDTPTSKIKFTIQQFANMSKYSNYSEYIYQEKENIKPEYAYSGKLGIFLTENDEKLKEQTKCFSGLVSIFHTARRIKDYYFSSGIFSFKHEDMTNTLNPFSNDGNKLQIKDKESVIKVIKEHESVTLTADVWEKVQQHFSIINFIDKLAIQKAIDRQNNLVKFINEGNITNDVCKWNIQRLKTLITDPQKLIREVYHEHLEDYAKSIGVSSAEQLITNLPPYKDSRIYDAIREQLTPFYDLIERAKEHTNDQTLSIWKDSIISINEDNQIQIDESERQKTLKSYFNCYEYDENNNISAQRLMNIENDINTEIGIINVLDKIWHILENRKLNEFS